MKIRIWLVTRERATWIAAAEILGLSAVLWVATESTVLRLAGFALIAHLGYMAMTGLPMGRIPGKPPGGQPRLNLDLRAQVMAFLREVRRVDEHTQRARVSGVPPAQLADSVRAGEQRVMAAAARVAKLSTRGSIRGIDETVGRETAQAQRGLSARARPRAGRSG